MSTPDPVAAELANLRGELSAFGRDISEIKVSCAVLVERSNRTDADLRRLRDETEKELGDLRKDVDALKERRFPLAVVGAMSGVAAVIVAVVTLLLR